MIRVASYNMRKAIGTDRRRRPERTLDVLNELDADVIALQEADRRFGSRASALPPRLIEEHSDYKPVELDARVSGIGWHGNALLVRKRIEVRERHLFHLPSLEPRGALRTTFRSGPTSRPMASAACCRRRNRASGSPSGLARRSARGSGVKCRPDRRPSESVRPTTPASAIPAPQRRRRRSRRWSGSMRRARRAIRPSPICRSR